MRRKALFLAAILALAFPMTVKAETCRELTDSYIESDNAPMLFDTTAYIEGTITATGRKAREGIAAGPEAWLGMCAVLYEANLENGEYVLGNMIGCYEILDTGYGANSHDGIKSKIRPDKNSRGTIEKGECLDIYCSSYSRAVCWMKETKGKCFAQIVAGKG